MFLFEFFQELLHTGDALSDLISSIGVGFVEASLLLKDVLELFDFVSLGEELFLEEVELGIPHFFYFRESVLAALPPSYLFISLSLLSMKLI